MTNELEIPKTENFALAKIEEISEEIIWLENFTSKATQKTYKATVKKFCSMFEIKNVEQLRGRFRKRKLLYVKDLKYPARP